jgi:CheY-like chemotaxis protein
MKKVLIIENSREIRENAVEILELNNYQVFVAEKGSPGFDLAKKYMPDIILCDIMRPETDSREFLRLAAEDKIIRDIPYILFSEDSPEPQIRKISSNKNNLFLLTKPFEANDLLNAITERLDEEGRRH